MSQSENPCGGVGPHAHASTRLARHIFSRRTSYGGTAVRVKQAPRVRYPNLSPTRAPAVAADASLWGAWTDRPFEPVDLDGFDSGGFPIRRKGGRS